MNKKVSHLGKRKANSSARKCPRKLHTSEYTNSCFKKKKFAFYFNEDTIDYNQQYHPLHLGNKQYKQFPQKRKNLKKEKRRGKEKKRECEREGKGEERREREEERVRTGRKRRRKRRRKKRKRKKRRKKRRKWRKRY